MKIFITLFLLLACLSFSSRVDTVIINTVKSEIDTIVKTDTIRLIDTVLIKKNMDFVVENSTDSSITIKITEWKVIEPEKKKTIETKKKKSVKK